MTPTEELYYVELDYACYGLIVTSGQVTKAPPIARWMIGKTLPEVSRWINWKAGKISQIKKVDSPPRWIITVP